MGIGFDIPADTAKQVVAQLKEKGHVTRGWIGVQIQPVTADIAESLGMKNAEDALVAEPQPGSPAAQAGVKAGDVEARGRPRPAGRATQGGQAHGAHAGEIGASNQVRRNADWLTVAIS